MAFVVVVAFVLCCCCRCGCCCCCGWRYGGCGWLGWSRVLVYVTSPGALALTHRQFLCRDTAKRVCLSRRYLKDL
eukprot:7817593-Ditylum_brightwellii.AAC.1